MKKLIVSAPVLTTTKNTVRLESKVSYVGIIFTLWVEVDKKYQDFLATDTTAFASPFIFPAARKKASVHINGNVSKQWLVGAKKIIARTTTWNHGFSSVPVEAEQEVPDAPNSTKNVGVFFSGGVDSFATLLKYQTNSKLAVTHLLFVHGFDIALDNTQLATEVTKSITAIAKKMQLPCICVRTNVREITDKLLGWEMAHGGALALVALMLRNGFSHIIIPGGGANDWAEPWGSSEYLDPCWSTESLEIIHDMDAMHRHDKVREYIAKSPTALEYLRVCWRNKAYNCGQCDKCMITMGELRMAGVLGQSKTFPHSIDLTKVANMYTTPFSNRTYVEDDLAYLEKTKLDPELEAALRASLAYSDNPGFKKQCLAFVQYLDWKYNESRLFVWLHKRLKWS